MQLGNFVKIDKDDILKHTEEYGDRKQKYSTQLYETGYKSVYPVTEHTTLFCVFSDMHSIKVYYIPNGEPLFRKYPKRMLAESFVFARGCKTVKLGTVINIRELPMDIQVAYLYFSSLHIRSNPIMRFIGSATLSNQIRFGERYSDVAVKELPDISVDAISELMLHRRRYQSAILANKAVYGELNPYCVSSFGDILNVLDSSERPETREEDGRELEGDGARRGYQCIPTPSSVSLDISPSDSVHSVPCEEALPPDSPMVSVELPSFANTISTEPVNEEASDDSEVPGSRPRPEEAELYIPLAFRPYNEERARQAERVLTDINRRWEMAERGEVAGNVDLNSLTDEQIENASEEYRFVDEEVDLDEVISEEEDSEEL